jgi:hypothetical protein
MAADPDKPKLSERLTRAMIKADSRPDKEVDEGPQTVEELEAATAGLDDKERLIGLAAAPLAGVIAILVVSSYGSKGATHTTTVDSSLFLVLFGLALVSLACRCSTSTTGGSASRSSSSARGTWSGPTASSRSSRLPKRGSHPPVVTAPHGGRSRTSGTRRG